MEATNSKSKGLRRKFPHRNIIKDTEIAEMQTAILNDKISVGNITVPGNTKVPDDKYDVRAIVLPNSNFAMIKSNLITGYKLIKYSKNISKIKKVIFIGYSHLSLNPGIYLSGYDAYEVYDFKRSYEIDKSLYDELMKVDSLRKYVEKFEMTCQSISNFVEENDEIIESLEEIRETNEDNEFTFDIHLLFLNHIFEDEKNPVKIIPIWVNVGYDVLKYLGSFLSTYLLKEEYLMIFSTNLTYFGRMYNYFGDEDDENYKNFKEKMFLRKPANEAIVGGYLKNIDEKAMRLFKSKNEAELKKASNLNYCKELFVLLMDMVSKKNEKNELLQLDYDGYRQEIFPGMDSKYEINIVTFATFIVYCLFN